MAGQPDTDNTAADPLTELYRVLKENQQAPSAHWRSSLELGTFAQALVEAGETESVELCLEAEHASSAKALKNLWVEEKAAWETLKLVAERRFRQDPELETVFRFDIDLNSEQSRIDVASQGLVMLRHNHDFSEFVFGYSSSIRDVVASSKRIAKFIKEFDKSQGDKIRRRYAVIGFWSAIFIFITSKIIELFVLT